MIKFRQAMVRMLVTAVVGLMIGGAIWLHEAKGAAPAPAQVK